MPSGHARTILARVVTLGLLGVAALVVLVLVLSVGTSYEIHARFQDAGQLVAGDQVQLGGHPVGSIASIGLTPDGLADVGIKIDSADLQPLHLGTTATIGSPGLSGVANRFVRIDPGPASAPEIHSGGVLGPESTHGIVDLDILIDGLDATSRKRLREVLDQSARLLRGPVAARTNRAFALLNPALAQTSALGHELVYDQAGLERLIRSAAGVSSTLAGRRAQLGDAVSSAAAALREIAGSRAALGELVGRAPSILRQAAGVLAHIRSTLPAIDAALAKLGPVVRESGIVGRSLIPVLRDAVPAIADIRRLLPAARSTLTEFPGVAATTVPALQSGTAAFSGLAPIVTGLRPYAPDLIAALVEGLPGNAAGYYDANGHFARIMLNSGPGDATANPFGGGTGGYRTGLVARCPGAASEPAPDNSNPYMPSDTANLCDPSQTPTP